MNPHTSKGASTLGVGVPMDSQVFRKQLQGSKLNELIIFYIIGNLLECRCLKWARMTNLDIWNTSYGQKKGWESNWQFNSWPLKVENHPDFLMCRWRATYRSKALNKDYNFALDLISIGGLHKKLWPAKSRESRLWEFQDSHLGISRKNAIWMWASWRGTKYTIRGKVVASLKSKPWWVLRVRVCPWFILAPKVFQLCTNQLVVWFCVGMCEWLSVGHSS